MCWYTCTMFCMPQVPTDAISPKTIVLISWFIRSPSLAPAVKSLYFSGVMRVWYPTSKYIFVAIQKQRSFVSTTVMNISCVMRGKSDLISSISKVLIEIYATDLKSTHLHSFQQHKVVHEQSTYVEIKIYVQFCTLQFTHVRLVIRIRP